MPTNGITEGRTTRIELDFPRPALVRPMIQVSRYNWQITESPDSDTAGQTWHLPGGAVMPRPYQFTEDLWGPNASLSIIKAADVNAVPCLTGNDVIGAITAATTAVSQQATLWNVMPAIGVVAVANATGAFPYLFQKMHAASETNWAQSLDADVAAFPQPPMEDVTVGLDRVLVTKQAYPANTGYILGLHFDGGPADHGRGPLLNFYFGGPAQTMPNGKAGGCLCASFRADGDCVLYEWLVEGWAEVSRFRWCDPGRARVGEMFTFIPHGMAGLDILFSHPTPSPNPKQRPLAVYRRGKRAEDLSLDGADWPVDYTRKWSTTGDGFARVDVRRDLGCTFFLARLTYPETAAIQMHPFGIPAKLPDGASLLTRFKAWLPDRAAPGLTAAAFDAVTGAALTAATLVAQGISGFSVPAGTSSVQVQASMVRSKPEQAPVLYGATAWVPGEIIELPGDLTSFVPLAGEEFNVLVPGADLYPDHETATVTGIEDPAGQLTKLRQKGRIPARIVTRFPTGQWATPYEDVILFQGEVLKPKAKLPGPGPVRRLRNGAFAQWPTPMNLRHTLDMVGPWLKLSEKMPFALFNFSETNPEIEPGVAADSSGIYPPWRITDIVAQLLNHCGVPWDMMDIPSLPVRFYPGGMGGTDLYTLEPAASYTQFLDTLLREFLGGWYLWWDPNCPARGRWRLQQPITCGQALAAFTANPPGEGITYGAQMPGRAGAYPVQTTFIQRGSLEWELYPPEANKITVTCTGQLVDSGESDSLGMVWGVNPVSYRWNPARDTSNPNHVDYLGDEVPIVVNNPALGSSDPQQTYRQLTAVLRYLAAATFHAQLWFRFTAPLMFVRDPVWGHWRPPKVYDPALVLGFPAWIRSCSIEYRRDNEQWGHYAGLFQTQAYPGVIV